MLSYPRLSLFSSYNLLGYVGIESTQGTQVQPFQLFANISKEESGRALGYRCQRSGWASVRNSSAAMRRNSFSASPASQPFKQELTLRQPMAGQARLSIILF